MNEEVLQERGAIGIWQTESILVHCEETAHFLIIETPVNQK